MLRNLGKVLGVTAILVVFAALVFYLRHRYIHCGECRF